MTFAEHIIAYWIGGSFGYFLGDTLGHIYSKRRCRSIIHKFNISTTHCIILPYYICYIITNNTISDTITPDNNEIFFRRIKLCIAWPLVIANDLLVYILEKFNDINELE